MPTRTDEERKFIDSLPMKQAGKKCNARTPNGYCKLPAGYGTDHIGTGRCKFHGGASPGKPLVTGLYSKKLKTTLKEEYEQLANDPTIVELKSELAFTKTLLSNFIDKFAVQLDSPHSNFWVDINDKGNKVISAEAKGMMSLLDTMSRIFQRVVDAEQKKMKHLDLDDIHAMIAQIKHAMNESCQTCPVRAGVGEKLAKIKLPHKP